MEKHIRTIHDLVASRDRLDRKGINSWAEAQYFMWLNQMICKLSNPSDNE